MKRLEGARATAVVVVSETTSVMEEGERRRERAKRF